MERDKEKGDFNIKMEAIIKVIGNKIKCMDMECYIIQMGKLHIKATGILMIFMVKVKYIMTILLHYRDLLIIQILRKLKIIGRFIKDNYALIKKMVKGK